MDSFLGLANELKFDKAFFLFSMKDIVGSNWIKTEQIGRPVPKLSFFFDLSIQWVKNCA